MFKPSRILLDPTTVCNLRCVQCHNAAGLGPTYFIDMKRVDEVVELSRTKPGILVNIAGAGDILCCPQWKQMIQKLERGNRISTEFYTNALLLTDKDIDFCWSLNTMKLIHVSVDGANAETYKNIRGADFGKLTDILKKLCSHHKKKAVRISMIVIKENLNQLKDFVDYALEVGVDIVMYQAIFDRCYTPINTPDGFVFDKSQMPYLSDIEELLLEAAKHAKKSHIFVDSQQMEVFSRKHLLLQWHKYATILWLRTKFGIGEQTETAAEEELIKAHPACFRPWRELSHVKEGWRICCMQHMNTSLGGKNATLEEAWSSPQLQRIRQQLLRRECPPECDPVYCYIAKRLQEK